MTPVYLSLGSNEGDRQITLQQALVLIEQRCGLITRQSSVYETAAWGLQEQPDFLNMAALLETELAPLALLDRLQQIELELHRQRVVKWGQRTIDIDILFYGGEVITDERLTVPHPMLHLRRFVLAPLAEIAPGLYYPGTQDTIADLLQHCPDTLAVSRVA